MAQQMHKAPYKGLSKDAPVRVRKPARITPYQDSVLVYVWRILGKFRSAMFDSIVDPWAGEQNPDPTPLVPPEDEPEMPFYRTREERMQQIGKIRVFDPTEVKPIPKEWIQYGDPHRFVNQWMNVGASNRYGSVAQQDFEVDPDVQRTAYYLAFFGELVDEDLP